MDAKRFVLCACFILQAAAAPPKMVFQVLVDDLGWGDVGFHRQPGELETPTPHLNALVAEGVEMDRWYVHQFCTPSRSSLLSGRLPVHVQQTLDNPEAPNSGIPRRMTAIGTKLQSAGWTTAVIGKWDAGMATHDHTPEGRGFNRSLIYYEHKVDYWTQTLMQSACEQIAPATVDLWADGAPARTINGTAYVEELFRARVLEIIKAHDFGSTPLYLLFTPHAAHCPLQVPRAALDALNASVVPNDEALCAAQTPYIFPGSTAADFRCRAQYSALVSIVDASVGAIVDAIRARGVWNETLMLFSSDNGGPLELAESGANNAPLRGGKYSDFEGGVRVAAFASGGYLPASVRGTKNEGIVHIADVYATVAGLAGVVDPTADPVAAAAGLPSIDSLDFWPLLSGANATSPRVEVPLSRTALLHGQFKYMRGMNDFATWTGERYPNASSAAHNPANVRLNCTRGCLFDVQADPTEHVNIAAAHPDVVAQLSQRLDELLKGYYSNNDTGVNVPECSAAPAGMPCACYLALPGNKWDGYFGPYQV